MAEFFLDPYLETCWLLPTGALRWERMGPHRVSTSFQSISAPPWFVIWTNPKDRSCSVCSISHPSPTTHTHTQVHTHTALLLSTYFYSLDWAHGCFSHLCVSGQSAPSIWKPSDCSSACTIPQAWPLLLSLYTFPLPNPRKLILSSSFSEQLCPGL